MGKRRRHAEYSWINIGGGELHSPRQGGCYYVLDGLVGYGYRT